MNILIEDLDEETVEKLKQQAAGKQRSLQAELKAIIEEAAAHDWQRSWAAADKIFEELRATGRKFSDSTELLREDRER